MIRKVSKMENIETVVQLISTVGFPIVCVWFLWRFVTTTMQEVKKTVDANTEAIVKLCERIGEKDD